MPRRRPPHRRDHRHRVAGGTQRHPRRAARRRPSRDHRPGGDALARPPPRRPATATRARPAPRRRARPPSRRGGPMRGRRLRAPGRHSAAHGDPVRREFDLIVIGGGAAGISAAIAVVVGTVLFCINQLDVVLRGDAGTVVWVKSAVTYVVPFCVSCAGVLVEELARGLAQGTEGSPPPAEGFVEAVAVAAADVPGQWPAGDAVALGHEQGIARLLGVDADEGDLAVELAGDLGIAGELGITGGAPGGEEVHHDRRALEVRQTDATVALERRQVEGPRIDGTLAVAAAVEGGGDQPHPDHEDDTQDDQRPPQRGPRPAAVRGGGWGWRRGLAAMRWRLGAHGYLSFIPATRGGPGRSPRTP